MNLNQSIDIYCERISPEIFSEPINFFTNIAFWVAFFLLLKKYHKKKNSEKWKEHARLDIMTFGWGNAANHYIVRFNGYYMDEFETLLLSKKEIECDAI